MREFPSVFLIERDIASDGKEGNIFNLLWACGIWWECVLGFSKAKKHWFLSEWKKRHGGK